MAVVFLNRALGQSPEDDLLLQMQGMFAEYERAKIVERCRRGRRHAAQQGAISVLSAAPYGYRYIRKQDGGGEARFEVVPEQARMVQQVFTWVGIERASMGQVSRRLTQAGVSTHSGKATWSPSAIWSMLTNPAYRGEAAFGRRQIGPPKPRLRVARGRSAHPRRAHSVQLRPPSEWVRLPVPALVSAELFEAVQAQLQENRRVARQGQRGARYLLQGLVTCAQCGYAFVGKSQRTHNVQGQARTYEYYRCPGRDANRFGGEAVCQNPPVRSDLLEQAVWQEVCRLLQEPQRLAREYERRLQPAEGPEPANFQAQLSKLRQSLARLIDSYADGYLEKAEFEPRVTRLRQRIAALESQAQQVANAAAAQAELRLIIGRLDDFAAKVRDGLGTADWPTQRELIRALVKRVEVGPEQVHVVFRVAPDPYMPSPEKGFLPDCTKPIRAPTVHDLR
jgi:site-specific DNA recombinase